MYGANLVHSNCGPAADDVSLKRTSPNRGCHQHLFSTSRQHYSLHSRVSLVLTVDLSHHYNLRSIVMYFYKRAFTTSESSSHMLQMRPSSGAMPDLTTSSYAFFTFSAPHTLRIVTPQVLQSCMSPDHACFCNCVIFSIGSCFLRIASHSGMKNCSRVDGALCEENSFVVHFAAESLLDDGDRLVRPSATEPARPNVTSEK